MPSKDFLYRWSSGNDSPPVDWSQMLLSTDITENTLLRQALAKLSQSSSLVVEAEKTGSPATQLSPLVLHIYCQLFSNLQRQSGGSLLLLAKQGPMHGFLISLRTCLKLEREELANRIDGEAFYLKLINELEKNVQLMLDILGGRSNASFADMGQAVESVIIQEEEDYSVQVNLSEEYSLVLACAWLNMKEACLLAAEMGCQDDEEVIERAGQLLIRVLTGTRHKGVLEAAAPALSDFCRHLLTSSNSKTCSFPEKWLKDVIDSLEGHTASVTRRSAGLPLLVRSLVSAEARGSSGGRHLLTLAVSKLLEILEKGQQQQQSTECETEDVPQCHALHVLRYVIIFMCDYCGSQYYYCVFSGHSSMIHRCRMMFSLICPVFSGNV